MLRPRPCRQRLASGSIHAGTATRPLSQSRGIAAFSVPTARCHVRRSKGRTAAVDRCGDTSSVFGRFCEDRSGSDPNPPHPPLQCLHLLPRHPQPQFAHPPHHVAGVTGVFGGHQMADFGFSVCRAAIVRDERTRTLGRSAKGHTLSY